MPTDGVLRSAHQLRRFDYHWRVILPVLSLDTDAVSFTAPVGPRTYFHSLTSTLCISRYIAVVVYALARVYRLLLTPVIAHWSRGRGLFRKVHPLAGQVRLVGCQSTMGAFQTPGREADSGCLPKGWTGLGGPLLATKDRRGFRIQWTFGPVSVPPDNNILLNNIKIRWLGPFLHVGIVEFSHLTLQNF